jgi:hypothetical protein
MIMPFLNMVPKWKWRGQQEGLDVIGCKSWRNHWSCTGISGPKLGSGQLLTKVKKGLHDTYFGIHWVYRSSVWYE